MPARGDDLADFMAKVTLAPSGCWEWSASRFPTGYGRFNRASRSTQLAHRWAWLLHRGEIPDGHELDHLCRNRGCVNPNHLEPVTRRENQRRGLSPSGQNARKTHCPQGHEYSPGNTYTNRLGHRHCRSCALAHSAAQRRDA